LKCITFVTTIIPTSKLISSGFEPFSVKIHDLLFYGAEKRPENWVPILGSNSRQFTDM
jgi:hypothetical protein